MLKRSNVEPGKITKERQRLHTERVQFIIMVATLLFMILACVWNTVQLNDVLLHVARDYVGDVSYRLARDVMSNLERDLLNEELVADTMLDIGSGDNTDEERQNFLNHEKEIIGFNCLTLLHTDGTRSSEKFCVQNLLEQSGVQTAFAGKSNVSYIEEGRRLLYAVPVRENGQVTQVLLGVREQDNMQEQIRLRSFKGKGQSCIVNTSGKLLISPSNTTPFATLDELFAAEGSDGTLYRVKQDILRRHSGLIDFRDATGEKKILSYQMMKNSDWVLMVSVPANMVAAQANTYIVRMVIIVAAIILLSLLFFGTTVRFYHQNDRKLNRVAYVDLLTGGMNRAAFQEAYNRLAKNMQPKTYAMVLLNIKDFNLVNDNWGLAVGDEVLRYVYRVLERNIAADELLSRSELDHYFLCLHDAEPQRILERIHHMEQDINSFAKNSTVHYTLQFYQGVYIIDNPQLDCIIVKDRVRTACRSQRLKGQSGCSFYSASLTEQIQMEQEVNNLLDVAIANKELVVYLQPKVRLLDGRSIGAEALVRWQHPTRGLLSPAEFIPLLEKNANVCKLDLYVFETVYALLDKWHKQGKPLPTIAVNLSRQHFMEADFLQPFIEVADRYKLPPDLIEFEVTESIFADPKNIAFIQQGIQQMHDHGFLCSMDDFGSGYSSLGLLSAFDVDELKLDRSFFVDVNDERTQTIIANLVDLAHQLDMQTVAEGIETEEQMAYLRQLHCDVVQGYVYARPLPIAEFEQWQQEMAL